MKPDSKKGFICLKKMMMKIPMTVLGGLQYGCHVDTFVFLFVSIPMTVFGGLQYAYTKNGAYKRQVVSIPMTVFGGLQSEEYYEIRKSGPHVSIPMTVFGGLQFLHRNCCYSFSFLFQYR